MSLFNNVRDKLRFSIFVFLLVFVLGSCTYIVKQTHLEAIQNRVDHDLDMIKGMFSTKVDDDMKKLEHYLKIIKQDSKIKTAFLNRDRKLLKELSSKYYSWLEATDSDRQVNMHYYLPKGTSFLRMHQPDKYEDSLRGIRPMVEAVHKMRVSQKGYELGKYGFYLHLVEPMYVDEKYIGAIGLGYNISSLLDNLKKITDGEYVIALTDACRCSEHLKAYKKLDVKNFRWVEDDLIIGNLPLEYYDYINLASKTKFETKEINERVILVNRSMDIKNFQNDSVAKLISFNDITGISKNYNEHLIIIAIIAILSLMIILIFKLFPNKQKLI